MTEDTSGLGAHGLGQWAGAWRPQRTRTVPLLSHPTRESLKGLGVPGRQTSQQPH